MNDNEKTIYLTTPIYYPNGVAHVGTVTTCVMVDFLSRAHKAIGYDVRFITGLDEHGGKVWKAAIKDHDNPMQYLDYISDHYKTLFSKYHIDYDIFYRTTDVRHKKTVQDIWNTLKESGYIYESTYTGLYSQSAEEFIDPKTKDKPADAEEITEKVYYLALSKLEGKLREYMKEFEYIMPNNRKNELYGFMSDGLKDLCVSRERLPWGIPVPNGTGVIYVWLDALTNYINATEYPNTNQYWSNVVHVMGKDIFVFHGIYWICILIALNKLPETLRLLIHNWWVVGGDKASKSKGNIIQAEELIEQYPVSMIRFYLLYANLTHQDHEFSTENMIEHYNSLLVNKISNLLYRIQVIMSKNNINLSYVVTKNTFYNQMKVRIESLQISQYIDTLCQRADALNVAIDKEQMWKNPHLIETIWEDVCNIYHFLQPILPDIKTFNSGMLFTRYS